MNLIFTQSLFAVEVQITESRNLRDTTTDGDGTLKVVGRLRAGSVIDIPDDYAVFENGKLNFDKSVQKWIHAIKDKDAKAPVFAKFDGKKQDYFIPIKIVQAADGSRVGDNKDVFVSIRDVGVVKDAATKMVAMQTTRDTDLVTKKPVKDNAMEAKCSGNCNEMVSPMNQLAESAKQMKALVAPQKAAKQAAQKETKTAKITDTAIGKYNALADTFKKECHIELSDFSKVIEQQIKDTPLRLEQVLAIMDQESTGICFPPHAAKPFKHGLFGIQDPSYIPEHICSKDQEKALKNTIASNDHVLEKT